MFKYVHILKFEIFSDSLSGAIAESKSRKILQRFVSFCISLIFTYCLFVEKNGDDLNLPSQLFLGDQMAISVYILKIVEKDSF